MPVADYKIYCEMLERAREGHFAYPAINVSSLAAANAVLRGLPRARATASSRSRLAAAAFVSGSMVKDMALGAISIAEHVPGGGALSGVCGLHTDHCQADKLDSWSCRWLRAETSEGRGQGSRTCSAATCLTAVLCLLGKILILP